MIEVDGHRIYLGVYTGIMSTESIANGSTL